MSKTKVQTPPGPLQTERLSSGNRKLIRDLVVKLDGGPKITVPKGFETDFSSIPWFARWFIDWAKVDIAGVVHDFLYWCPKHAQKLGITTRMRADDVWWELAGAGAYCANRLQRGAGWCALRLCGWRALRKAHRIGGRTCTPQPSPPSPPQLSTARSPSAAARAKPQGTG